MKINIGVIFGGRSGEHEVSIRSAKAVIESIDAERYSVIPIAISPEGKWLSPAEAMQLLPDGARNALDADISSWSKPVALVGDTGFRGLTTMDS